MYFGNANPERIYRVKGDGNCFFRAIAYYLTGSQEGHLHLRNVVLGHMQGAMKHEMEAYLNSTMENYVDSSGMSKDGTWATEAEILGAASRLCTDIKIFSRYSDTNKWLTYPSSLRMGTYTEDAILLENTTGVHFNVVISCQK